MSADQIEALRAEGCHILTVYDVDAHTEDEYGPDGLNMIHTDVDEPGDLREWLSGKLDEQHRTLQAMSREGAAAPLLDGIAITVHRDADVRSYSGDCDRPHTLFIVERGSGADSQLATWHHARPIDFIVIANDGTGPRCIRGPAGRWEGLVLGLARQWMASCLSCRTG